VTENARKGAHGFVLPAGHAPGNPSENRLLPQTATELDRAGPSPGRSSATAAFGCPDRRNIPRHGRNQIQLSGRHEPGSRRTHKRRARYRTGIEVASSISSADTDYADPD
jgi:hypothetical protein